MEQLNTELSLILTALFGLCFMVLAIIGWKQAFGWQRRANALELQQAGQGAAHSRVEELEEEIDEERSARLEVERKLSAAQQQLVDMQKQHEQAVKDLEAFKQSARASVMQAGQELSSKLLEDHQREAKARREEQEQFTQKTTHTLVERVEKLNEAVAAYAKQTSQNSLQVETVMRALTHPAGAGQMAEAGLENTLKQLGLEPGRDFLLQYHITTDEGPNLRPDAVVFLPQDMVMVIDSKASKHLMELAEVEGTLEEERVMAQLTKSMHSHIDQLTRKAYHQAVTEQVQKQGRMLGRMLNVMYVPSDAALEKLRLADRSLMDKAQKHELILAGPSSLMGLCSLARQQIASARQDANQQKIIGVTSEVMDSLITALRHVDGVGKGIESSAKKFKDFAGSLNARLLPKLRQLEQLGVHPSKQKNLPHSISSYEVYKQEDILSLQAEEEASSDSPRELEKV